MLSPGFRRETSPQAFITINSTQALRDNLEL
jgi:hypothetical protein